MAVKKKAPVKKVARKKVAPKEVASMVWMKSPNGLDVITLGDTNYLSFGKNGTVRWMHLSYVDGDGVRRGDMLPVAFAKMKTEHQKIIGKKNCQTLKTIFRDVVVDEAISRDKFYEIGERLKLEASK